MRRKDKEIIDKELIEEILERNRICRIGFVDGERPYIIPMNYGYKDNNLYVHSALEGKKIDILNINNNVTFFDPVKAINLKYQEASIYLLTSRFEGFGMVLIDIAVAILNQADISFVCLFNACQALVA